MAALLHEGGVNRSDRGDNLCTWKGSSHLTGMRLAHTSVLLNTYACEEVSACAREADESCVFPKLLVLSCVCVSVCVWREREKEVDACGREADESCVFPKSLVLSCVCV